MRGNGGVIELTSRTAILLLSAMVIDILIVQGREELASISTLQLRMSIAFVGKLWFLFNGCSCCQTADILHPGLA